MFKNILVPTDGSPLSDKVIKYAVDFAKDADAKLVAISIAEPYLPLNDGMAPDPLYMEEWQHLHDEQVFKLAHDYVQRVSDAAKAAGVSCKTMTAINFNPYEEIVNAAEKCGCDVIFMASHGRKGLNKLFLGSETQKVLANATVPVLVIR